MFGIRKRNTARSAFKQRDVAASLHVHDHKLGGNRQVADYLGDLVLGGIDGIITTFAIVAGVEGANLSTGIVVILGLANLLADGFSMGVGNYLGLKSETDFQKSERERELWEIDNLPDKEEAEVREIYRAKGFSGKLLDDVVQHIVSDEKRWLDTMMVQELGIIENRKSAFVAGLLTFCSFIVFGAIPLLAYAYAFVFEFEMTQFLFPLTCVMTAVGLFLVGALRSLFTFGPILRSGFEILLLGGAAGGLSYLVGYLLRSIA